MFLLCNKKHFILTSTAFRLSTCCTGKISNPFHPSYLYSAFFHFVSVFPFINLHRTVYAIYSNDKQIVSNFINTYIQLTPEVKDNEQLANLSFRFIDVYPFHLAELTECGSNCLNCDIIRQILNQQYSSLHHTTLYVLVNIQNKRPMSISNNRNAEIKTENEPVHWRIIANLGFKFRSHFTAHCGHRCSPCCLRADHLTPC